MLLCTVCALSCDWLDEGASSNSSSEAETRVALEAFRERQQVKASHVQ